MQSLRKILILIFVSMSFSIVWSLTQEADIAVEHQPSEQSLLDLDVKAWQNLA